MFLAGLSIVAQTLADVLLEMLSHIGDVFLALLGFVIWSALNDRLVVNTGPRLWNKILVGLDGMQPCGEAAPENQEGGSVDADVNNIDDAFHDAPEISTKIGAVRARFLDGSSVDVDAYDNDQVRDLRARLLALMEIDPFNFNVKFMIETNILPDTMAIADLFRNIEAWQGDGIEIMAVIGDNVLVYTHNMDYHGKQIEKIVSNGMNSYILHFVDGTVECHGGSHSLDQLFRSTSVRSCGPA